MSELILSFLLQDLAFQSQFSERVLDVDALSPALDKSLCKVSALSMIRDQSWNGQVKTLHCGILIAG